MLTDDQAAEIFNLRVPFTDSTSATRDRVFTSRSIVVSRIYGVSPKAVRDIWNKRTWRHATRALWTEADEFQHAKNLKAGSEGSLLRAATKKTPSLRSVGRPRGSKDSKPRRPRRPRSMGAGFVEDEKSCALTNNDSDISEAEHPEDAAEPMTESGLRASGCSLAKEDQAPPCGEEVEVGDEEDDAEEVGEEDGLYRFFPFFLQFPLVAGHDLIDSL